MQTLSILSTILVEDHSFYDIYITLSTALFRMMLQPWTWSTTRMNRSKKGNVAKHNSTTVTKVYWQLK